MGTSTFPIFAFLNMQNNATTLAAKQRGDY
jgi:hypothetical protein